MFPGCNWCPQNFHNQLQLFQHGPELDLLFPVDNKNQEGIDWYQKELQMLACKIAQRDTVVVL
jgi:hypothetical protein